LFQFSLRNLLIAVAFCAFGAAALVNANPWWLAISWSVMLFSLIAAGLLVWHRREEKRAFWGGYLLCGSLYLLLLMYSIQPVSSSNSSLLCLDSLSHQKLLTTKLTNWSYSFLPASLTTEYLPSNASGSGGMGSSSGSGSSGPSMGGGMGGGPGSMMSGGMPGMPGMPGASGMGMGPGAGFATPNPRFVDQMTYTEVGHALWTVIIAALGGLLSSWLHRTRQRSAAGN
jgi:hypothetical protein